MTHIVQRNRRGSRFIDNGRAGKLAMPGPAPIPTDANPNPTPMDTLQAYQVLGLDPGASDAQLKAAWRRLVAAWHPDRYAAQDAGSRMQSINKAYQHIRQLN